MGEFGQRIIKGEFLSTSKFIEESELWDLFEGRTERLWKKYNLGLKHNWQEIW